MTIIPQNNRYLPHELKTKYYAVKLYRTEVNVFTKVQQLTPYAMPKVPSIILLL